MKNEKSPTREDGLVNTLQAGIVRYSAPNVKGNTSEAGMLPGRYGAIRLSAIVGVTCKVCGRLLAWIAYVAVAWAWLKARLWVNLE